MDRHHGFYHPRRPPQWVVSLKVGVNVLLKKVLLVKNSHIESDLVDVSKCKFSSQLGDLVKLFSVQPRHIYATGNVDSPTSLIYLRGRWMPS
nr:hypothetical protein CFP56_30087 [Quercus suber]